MAYSRTVAARPNNRNPLANINRPNLFIADKILEEIWENPVQISRSITLYDTVKKKFDEVIKPSAMHTKEGHALEAKAVVWNNPLKPLEVSHWGELNNIGGGGRNIFGNKSNRARVQNNRSSRFIAALRSEEERCVNKIAAAVHKGKPPPPPSATQKVRKDYWGSKVLDWENSHPEDARPDGKPTWDPERNRTTVGPAVKGNQHMPLIFKNERAYFISPKLSTVELRPSMGGDIDIFNKGKGKSYIELDGLIHFRLPNGGHKFIILELKKQLGAQGFEDAQQMRKAAVLLRKWGYELTGRVPIVELYFAAGAADRFAENSNGYQYKSEEGPIQDWTQTRINERVAGARQHIAYIKTPIMLLTGLGLADLLRMDSWRFAKLRETLSTAQEFTDKASNYFLGKIYSTIDQRYLLKKVRGGFEPIAPSELKNSSVTLYLDLGEMAKRDAGFRAAIPPQWRPDPTKIHPSGALARVAESLLYINALKRKMAKPGISNEKKSEYEKIWLNYHKYLLSNKYKKYLKPNQAAALSRNLAAHEGFRSRLVRRFLGGRNVASPNRNVKFYSRIFKETARQPVTYFKLPKTNNQYPSPGKGEWRTKQSASKLKIGMTKIRGPNAGVLPEYLFKGVANINFGNVANLTPNKISNVNDDTMARWMQYITKRLAARNNLDAAKKAAYKKLINSAKQVYSRPVTNLTPKQRNKRNGVRELINVANKAFAKFTEMRQALPSPPRPTTARSAPRRAAASAANARIASVTANERQTNSGTVRRGTRRTPASTRRG